MSRKVYYVVSRRGYWSGVINPDAWTMSENEAYVFTDWVAAEDWAEYLKWDAPKPIRCECGAVPNTCDPLPAQAREP